MSHVITGVAKISGIGKEHRIVERTKEIRSR